jgi:hypothetical protein
MTTVFASVQYSIGKHFPHLLYQSPKKLVALQALDMPMSG